MKAISTTYDVAIIGGGASGLAAALSCARAGGRPVVLERDVEAGLSILATGNGRCNLSNARIDPERYRHPDVAQAVFGEEPERELAAFFLSTGIVTCEVEGRLYPFSKRAESVRDALLRACERKGARILPCCDIQKATRTRGVWELAALLPRRTPRGKRDADAKANLRARRRELADAERIEHRIAARSVIIACGGTSRETAALFGLPHLAEHPVLCPLSCSLPDQPGALKALDGLRVDAKLTLYRGGAGVWSEAGEVLFRPYGISGIAAFNLSRRARPGDAIEIDPFYPLTPQELSDVFSKRSLALGAGPDSGPSWFDGFLARPIASVLSQAKVHSLRLQVEGTADERSAQVRRGGIPFDAVELPDLRVRPDLAPQVLACGEALDMDADCGGYNLAWAWASGLRAGAAALA